MASVQPVLLSGGSGTRLWPLSREAYPKQFLALAGEDTMLQATWRRVAPLTSAAPLVVANEEHRFLVAEQLRVIGAPAARIVLEPVGRNTAPAIAAAALVAMADGSDPLLLVLPSDHVVRDADAFRAAVEAATPAAEAGALVTFGIVPSGPRNRLRLHSGRGRPAIARRGPIYGAIAAASSRSRMWRRAQAVSSTAGDYLWNSGMFLFQAPRAICEELEKFTGPTSSPPPAPCARICASRCVASRDLDFTAHRRETHFASLAVSDSIDYAVMEKTGGCGGGAARHAGWNGRGFVVGSVAGDAVPQDSESAMCCMAM